MPFLQYSICLCIVHIHIYDRLSVWTQIGIHSLNLRPLTSLSQIMVRFRSILKWASFPNIQIDGRLLVSDVIGHQFKKVRNGHRYENWTPI